MKEMTIQYSSLFGGKNFELNDTGFARYKLVPQRFNYRKNEPEENKKHDETFKGKHQSGYKLDSGLRRIRDNLLYGDFMVDDVRSLVFLLEKDKGVVELRIFPEFYPAKTSERSSFFSWYFDKTGIASNDFINPRLLENRYKKKMDKRKRNRRNDND